MEPPGADLDATLADRDLLEGVRRRDPEALGLLFEAVFPLVFGLSVRLLGDRSRAEDATQDVFARVHAAADRLDPSRSLRPWLTTIALNVCRDVLRRRGRRRESPLDPGVLDGIRHTEERPEYQLVRKEREALLLRALDSLDAKHREVVVLRVNGGLSHEEAAASLGISPAAARKRYSRALRKLRDFIERHES
jgi:RNA polymerase sigma-70 factor (ECF subfamily)